MLSINCLPTSAGFVGVGGVEVAKCDIWSKWIKCHKYCPGWSVLNRKRNVNCWSWNGATNFVNRRSGFGTGKDLGNPPRSIPTILTDIYTQWLPWLQEYTSLRIGQLTLIIFRSSPSSFQPPLSNLYTIPSVRTTKSHRSTQSSFQLLNHSSHTLSKPLSPSNRQLITDFH